MDLVKVLDLTRRGHRGQKRKDSGVDYIEHPLTVVTLLGRWGVSDELLAIAYMHDLLEDTSVSINEIREVSNERVLNSVIELSKDSGISKEQYIRELAINGHYTSIIVKMFDRIANTRDFIEAGKVEYAKKYFLKATLIFNRFMVDEKIPDYLKTKAMHYIQQFNFNLIFQLGV